MFFLQYLLGRFKSKGGSRETNQWKKKESIDMETWQNTRYIYWPSGTQAGEIEGAISLEISSRVFLPSCIATTWDIVGLREGDWSVHKIWFFFIFFPIRIVMF